MRFLDGRPVRRLLWITTFASWSAEGALGRWGLHVQSGADIAAGAAAIATVGVAVSLWRRVRQAERSGRVTWFESPELTRRVADLEQRCAAYEARFGDIFATMEAAAEAAGISVTIREPSLRLCGGTDVKGNATG